MFIRRNGTGGESHRPGDAGPGVLGKAHPAIWEYLTQDKWEDGKARQTSTLQLFCDRGCVKALLRDRDAGQVCFVAGRTPEEALEALELALVAGTAEWREDNYKKRR